MKLNLSALLRGSEKEFSTESFLDYKNIALQEEYVFQHPIKVTVLVENRAGSLKLFATIETLLSVHCGRCLKDIDVPMIIHFDSLLSEKLENEDAENILPIHDAKIDLEDILYETIILHVEPRYFCREDCKGLCPNCGKDLNENACTCKEESADPRLAVLKKLLK